jgi:hypothetical protein
MTLPEMKIGLVELSVELGMRAVGGRLRDPDAEPVDPVPRCAAAANESKNITKVIWAMKRTNLGTMGASIQLRECYAKLSCGVVKNSINRQ